MGHSSVLFITLFVSSLTRGSLIQSTHVLDNSDSILTTQSAGSLNRDVILHSVRVGDTAEGSGDTVDTRASQISKTAVPKPAGTENTSGLTSTTAAPLHHSHAHDQESDKGDSSVAGGAESSARLFPEEALLEGSHTADEQIKHSHSSTVNLDFPSGE